MSSVVGLPATLSRSTSPIGARTTGAPMPPSSMVMALPLPPAQTSASSSMVARVSLSLIAVVNAPPSSTPLGTLAFTAASSRPLALSANTSRLSSARRVERTTRASVRLCRLLMMTAPEMSLPVTVTPTAVELINPALSASTLMLPSSASSEFTPVSAMVARVLFALSTYTTPPPRRTLAAPPEKPATVLCWSSPRVVVLLFTALSRAFTVTSLPASTSSAPAMSARVESRKVRNDTPAPIAPLSDSEMSPATRSLSDSSAASTNRLRDAETSALAPMRATVPLTGTGTDVPRSGATGLLLDRLLLTAVVTGAMPGSDGACSGLCASGPNTSRAPMASATSWFTPLATEVTATAPDSATLWLALPAIATEPTSLREVAFTPTSRPSTTVSSASSSTAAWTVSLSRLTSTPAPMPRSPPSWMPVATPSTRTSDCASISTSRAGPSKAASWLTCAPPRTPATVEEFRYLIPTAPAMERSPPAEPATAVVVRSCTEAASIASRPVASTIAPTSIVASVVLAESTVISDPPTPTVFSPMRKPPANSSVEERSLASTASCPAVDTTPPRIAVRVVLANSAMDAEPAIPAVLWPSAPPITAVVRVSSARARTATRCLACAIAFSMVASVVLAKRV